MYDLMGKAAGVPVYKLFGQRYRRWVPVASWTVSTHPKRMAQAVERFSAMGYTWMKYHLSPFENVMDQMDAMQAVAPEGFRIHHDITMHGTNDHMFELLEKISKYRIAGCFEDPLQERDIEGYAELRKRCRLPIIYHHTPLGATLRSAEAGGRCLHAGTPEDRSGPAAGRPVCGRQHPLHAAERRRQHHPSHDRPHAVGLQDGQLPLRQHFGKQEVRRGPRAHRSGERICPGAGTARTGGDPGSSRSWSGWKSCNCPSRTSGSSRPASPTAPACTTSTIPSNPCSWCAPTAGA